VVGKETILLHFILFSFCAPCFRVLCCDVNIIRLRHCIRRHHVYVELKMRTWKSSTQAMTSSQYMRIHRSHQLVSKYPTYTQADVVLRQSIEQVGNVGSSLNVIDQVSHPYKTISKIISRF
jgi:hypothetical protein